MWHVPGELHNVSLRFMRRLMHLLLLLPPQQNFTWKILYSISLYIYILSIFQWRFAFNYKVVYDVINDDLSRALDLVNFVALIVGHSVVAMQLLWRNRSEQIEQQLQHIRYILRIQFGHKVNLKRIDSYCNVIYRISNTSLLLICHFYSEIVLTLRCLEFSLHSTLVLAIYNELIDAGNAIVAKLSNTRHQMQSGHDSYVDSLFTLQQLHQQLWKTHRDIEKNFERSLIVIMMKSFIDTSVMPYWVYFNSTRIDTIPIQLFCISEEFGKLLEICIPSWICTRCDQFQRKLRSVFHGVSTNRRHMELNSALLRLLNQLSQERSQFSIGGYLTINNKMLGKFLFGVVSYIIVCIQFRIIFVGQSFDSEESNVAILCQNISQI